MPLILLTIYRNVTGRTMQEQVKPMRRCRIESLGVSLPRRHLLHWGSIRHAEAAGRKCLKVSHHRPADIGLLINAGIHRDQHICEPAMAIFIQHKLGINIEFQQRSTLAFDLLNGGCGMLDALQVASAMLQTGEVEAALVVASEVNADRHADPGYTYPASGAAVLLDLSPWPESGFGSFVFQTRDECRELYTSVVSLLEKRGRIYLKRQQELENTYRALLDSVVEELLDIEHLCREEIDFVVCAQLSTDFIARLPNAIRFAPDKVIDLTAQLPDTLSTSLFLAWQRAIAVRVPQVGQKALLLACGSGVTVAAASYYF